MRPGVGSALKALKTTIKVFGAEPETAAPLGLSLKLDSLNAFRGAARALS